MRWVFGLVAATVVLAFMTIPASAGSVYLGYISFDNLIPGAPGSPGVNAFTLANLTGDPSAGGNDLPPTFPVLTSVTLLNSSLEWFSAGASNTVPTGDLGPGFFNPFTLQFPDTDTFTSALFTATLNTMSLQLDGGGVFTAASDQISVMLAPSSGNSLMAGADSALIAVSSPSAVPEPRLTYLLGALLLGLWLVRESLGQHLS